MKENYIENNNDFFLEYQNSLGIVLISNLLILLIIDQ